MGGKRMGLHWLFEGGRGRAGPFTHLMAAAQRVTAVDAVEGVHGGELVVAVNKSQVLRIDRPFAKALIGNPEIADVLPLTDQSLYVLGKKTGTTSLTLYDRRSSLIAVVDVVVGPDVTRLKRQLSELMPSDEIGARMSNDSVVLEASSSAPPPPTARCRSPRPMRPGKVINLLSIGSAQQVMLEVRFSEMKRGALKHRLQRLRRAMAAASRAVRQRCARSRWPTHDQPSGRGRTNDDQHRRSSVDRRQLRASWPASSTSGSTSTPRSTRSSARARSPRWPSRPWSRCRARPRTSLPAANSRSRWPGRRRAATTAAASPSSSSRSASAWPSRRPCSRTASSTWWSSRRSARSTRLRSVSRQQPAHPRPADAPREDDGRASRRRELRHGRPAPARFPGHGPAVPDPRLDPDHRHPVPVDQLPERRDRAGDHRHPATGAAGAARTRCGCRPTASSRPTRSTCS